MLDAFSCDVAILAMRVNHLLAGGKLRDIFMGLSWYDGYVILIAVIKKFLALLGIAPDTVSVLIGVDVFAFFIGLGFLLNFVASRFSVLVTLLVAIILVSAPGVLPVVFLGHGHSIVFMLFCIYIWLSNKIVIDSKGFYVLKQFILLLVVLGLVCFIRPQDALFGLPALSIIFLDKVKAFHWRKTRFFMYLLPLILCSGVFFMFSCMITHSSFERIFKVIHLFSYPVILSYTACFLCGMGLMGLAIFFPRKNFSYWSAAVVFTLSVMLAISSIFMNFEFRFVFPSIAFWCVVLAAVLEDAWRKFSSRKLLRLVFSIVLVVGICWQFSLVEEFFVYRMLSLDKRFVVNLKREFHPDIVVAQDTAPFFVYYGAMKVLRPPVDLNLSKARLFWKHLLKLKQEGKAVVVLSSIFSYDRTHTLIKAMPKGLFLRPIYGGYFLDWHNCHSIIPFLQWSSVYSLEVKKGVTFKYGQVSCSRCADN